MVNVTLDYMAKIVAIGGGGDKYVSFTTKTLVIDREIVNLTGSARPSVLFVPTANDDDPNYSQSFRQYYEQHLGCKVDILNLSTNLSHANMTHALQTADIIYVGGGDTFRMIRRWRKTGFDRLLIEASRTDKVLAGVSAGAICWFEAGISDSRRYTHRHRPWPYINVHGLNAIKGLAMHKHILCPHYDTEPRRHAALKRSLKHSNKIGIALEERVALEINDGLYRIIAADTSKHAYKAYWEDGEYQFHKLDPSLGWQVVSELNLAAA
jgi:dipeptidase E